MLGATIKCGYSGPSMAGGDWCIIDRARRLVGDRMDSRTSSPRRSRRAPKLWPWSASLDRQPRFLEFFAGLRILPFTLAFRRLCAADADETADVKARGLFANPRACDSWATRWRSRLAVDGREPNARVKSMWDVNPFFVPRNHHRVEQARHRESLKKAFSAAAIAPTRSSSTLR